MGEITNETRVYSADKKVWIGMKAADANKTEEDMKIFNFADRNGDGEIQDWELDRYNGPLLVENFPERKGRIIGHAGLRPLNAIYLEDNEVDFYPGLKIENVDKSGRITFNRIDCSPRDNVLSKSEMEEATDVKEKCDKTEAKLRNIEDTRGLLKVLGIAGIAGLGSCVSGLLANTRKAGWIGALTSIGIATALCLTNRHVAKSKAQKEIDKLQQETNNHPYLKDKIEELKDIV